MEPTPLPKKRRTNDEILAAFRAERAQPPKKRKRRTYAEIERDNRRAANEKLKKELAAEEVCKVVTFFDEVNAFGKLWTAGEEVKLVPTSYYHSLAFDKFNNFILDKTPIEQFKQWGKVKYEVREEKI